MANFFFFFSLSFPLFLLDLEDGGVTDPEGFQAAGISAGLRASSARPDLALVYCPDGAVAAGVFTQNLVCAAPVTYCKDALKESQENMSSVLINAGQANAATGESFHTHTHTHTHTNTRARARLSFFVPKQQQHQQQPKLKYMYCCTTWILGSAGWEDAVSSANTLSKKLGVPAMSILLESTGVIGQRIKIDKMLSAIPQLVSELSDTELSSKQAAMAITTTDLVYKSTSIQVEVGGHTVTLGGMCKGSGMIHPNMATMLGVVTCDAQIEPKLWQKMLKNAVVDSFNQITVDGDTSTNDTVVALASGKVPVSVKDESSDGAIILQEALTALCQGLGKSIAWDGEGANVLIAVKVVGADNKEDARVIARSIASSSLAKSAIFGQDPNWGRIAAAAGYAGPSFDVDMLDIELGETKLMEKGQPLAFDAAKASAYLKSKIDKRGVVDIYVKIGDGSESGIAWGCDLSYDYVKINAEYTT